MFKDLKGQSYNILMAEECDFSAVFRTDVIHMCIRMVKCCDAKITKLEEEPHTLPGTSAKYSCGVSVPNKSDI